MLNRLSSSTWQHITDPQSCSLYGFNVAFDRKKWISLENSLREIVKMIFSPWICGGLCREYWDLDLFVSSQKFCHFSALWLVLLFLIIWVFLHFAYRYIVRLLYVQMTNDFQNSSWQGFLSCDKFREGYENHITYQTL